MTSLQARIDAMRDELVNHRGDGYATTTDVLLLLELVEAMLAAGERDTAINDEADMGEVR